MGVTLPNWVHVSLEVDNLAIRLGAIGSARFALAGQNNYMSMEE
jgi:hypothetical protein